LPMGPVRQYVEENPDAPIDIVVRPGGNASFLLYEDDGRSFHYKRGEWMGIAMNWNDAKRTLALRLARGSKMLTPVRKLVVRLGEENRPVNFEGRQLLLRL